MRIYSCRHVSLSDGLQRERISFILIYITGTSTTEATEGGESRSSASLHRGSLKERPNHVTKRSSSPSRETLHKELLQLEIKKSKLEAKKLRLECKKLRKEILKFDLDINLLQQK